MTRSTPLIAVALGAALLGSALGGAPQSRDIVITAVNVVDVEHGHVIPRQTVIVRGDTIVAVAPTISADSSARAVDGKGRFLIPGLWDMHAHLQGTGRSSLPLYVANGVTGVRDMGSDLSFILPVRRATSSGETLGPTLLVAGPILDDSPGDWPWRQRVRNGGEARAAVALLHSQGVDLVKVHTFTPREAFFAIAGEARRRRLPLAGHVPKGITIEQALDAGLASVEHLSEMQLWRPCSGGKDYRREKCEVFFRDLARRRVWQTPTLLARREGGTIGTDASTMPVEQLAYASREVRALWRANQGFITEDTVRILRWEAAVGATVTKDMAKLGVPVLAGCDGMIPGFCVHDELAAMVEGGMSTLAALQTATLNPARYFRREQMAGRVAAGRRADLVLLDANPLDDIRHLRRIRAVVVAGKLVERGGLDALLAEARDAALW